MGLIRNTVFFFKDYGQRQLWKKLYSELENLFSLVQVFIVEHIFEEELDVDMKWR